MAESYPNRTGGSAERAAISVRHEPTRAPSVPIPSHSATHHPGSARDSVIPSYQRLRQVGLAVAIVGGPLAFTIGGLLSPTVQFDGAALIAANADANPILNVAHLVGFLVGSFLLPVSILGLAQLVYQRAPWLATIGGVLGVVGWLPLAALTALDGLIYTMANQPDGLAYAGLLNAFYQSPLMLTFLLVYIIGHLLTYVLLGIALDRTRLIPRWAAWSIIASSPLTILMFALPGNPQAVGGGALTLLVIGSIPAARAVATQHCRSRP